MRDAALTDVSPRPIQVEPNQEFCRKRGIQDEHPCEARLVELVGADAIVGNRTKLEDDPTQHDVGTQDWLCARRDYTADRLDNKGNDILQMSTIC